MVVVFAHTGGGLVGAEAGIAGGGAVLGQKILEAVFGDQAVRTLAERARQDLEQRISALFDAERRRYTDLLDSLGVQPGAAVEVREAARRIDDLRFAALGRGEAVSGRAPSRGGAGRGGGVPGSDGSGSDEIGRDEGVPGRDGGGER